MAELVVDRLESVEINQNHPDRRRILASRIQGISRLGFKKCTVRKAGEMILLQRCHVGVHDDGANSLIRCAWLANQNLKQMMPAIEGAGIGCNELPQFSAENLCYPFAYDPSLRAPPIGGGGALL